MTTLLMGRLYLHANCPELATDKTAMVVNMTSLKQPQIRNNIFYAEPERFASMLETRFGRTSFATTRYLTDDTSFVVTRR